MCVYLSLYICIYIYIYMLKRRVLKFWLSFVCLFAPCFVNALLFFKHVMAFPCCNFRLKSCVLYSQGRCRGAHAEADVYNSSHKS